MVQDASSSDELQPSLKPQFPALVVPSEISDDQRKQMKLTGSDSPTRSAVPLLATSSFGSYLSSYTVGDGSYLTTTVPTTSGADSFKSSENIRSPIQTSEQLVATTSHSEELHSLTGALEKQPVS